MALDTAKKEFNENALKHFRKQDQGVFHLFPRAAPSPCQLVLFSKMFREILMSGYISVPVDFYDNFKILKLEQRLGIKAVESYLRLCMWAEKNSTYPIINSDAWHDIEVVAKWDGSSHALFGNLLELCLIEEVCPNTKYKIVAIEGHCR